MICNFIIFFFKFGILYFGGNFGIEVVISMTYVKQEPYEQDFNDKILPIIQQKPYLLRHIKNNFINFI